ncbi:MAG: 23S rRNA (guanosine(2251)-2'-O)-methyltransferase RlmB [Actinobacteria bacterium]|nr:23S rRNA (guanosine(2251)-2'-O)-methyltransferase RlmB [Actinomycetota bacterium]
MRDKPRRGNRGQVRRDAVARKEAAKRAAWGKPAPAQQQPPRRRATGAGGGAGEPVRGRPSAPRGLGGEQVEGRRAVRELLIAGRRRVKDVWIAEGVDDSAVLHEIVELATDSRIAVRRVARSRLDGEARTDSPQGVLAHAEPLPEAELDDLITPDAFLLCLDGITDPHNLGALLRTAECAGVTGVVLPKHRAVHITPTVAKTAAGAVEYLPIAVVPGIPAALRALTSAGVWSIGLDADASGSIFQMEFDVAGAPVALVLGAEGAGLSRLARERCDLVAAIPQRGAIDSLNVAAAGAVACFEVARRRSS